MGELQPWHWVIVIAVFVVLFGAKKLPDAARSLGTSMRIIRTEMTELNSERVAVVDAARSTIVPTPTEKRSV